MKKTENMKKTKYRKLQDRRKYYVHLHSIITYQSPAVRSCLNILYAFSPLPLPICEWLCLTCLLLWSFTEPAAKTFLRYLSQVCHSSLFNFPWITWIFSLVLGLSFFLSFCLPLSRSLFLYFVFCLPRVPQNQTSWLWTAFFLPLWGLTSHSRPWVFLPEGSWATEVW